MATLISPVEHTVTRKFRLDVRTEKLRVFDFSPGEPVNDIPDEYAENLHATYPDKYYTPAEWKQRSNNQDVLAGSDSESGFPTLEQLKATALGDLKPIADELGIKYAQNISGKTLAERIFDFYNTAPEKETAVSDKDAVISEGE